MQFPEPVIVASRWAAVLGAVFASVVMMAYMALVVWDKTHQPRIPGWTAIPSSPHGVHAAAPPPGHA
jgi:hypothetical protein